MVSFSRKTTSTEEYEASRSIPPTNSIESTEIRDLVLGESCDCADSPAGGDLGWCFRRVNIAKKGFVCEVIVVDHSQ